MFGQRLLLLVLLIGQIVAEELSQSTTKASGLIDELIDNGTDFAEENSTLSSIALTNLTNTSNILPTKSPNLLEEKLHYPEYDARFDYCSCNLKPEFCDLNCCCDSDCDEEEKSLFAFCEEIKSYNDHDDGDYCFREYPIYINNTKYLMKQSSSGLFCILYDNVKDLKVYGDRKPVSSVQEYRKIAPSKLFAWTEDKKSTPDVPITKMVRMSQSFRYGDPIWATSITSRGIEINEVFRLPSSFLNGYCDTLKPIVYLKSSSFSCLRDIKNYERDCQSQPFLGPAIYFENLFISKLGAVQKFEPETRTYYQIEYDSLGSRLALNDDDKPINWTSYSPLFPACLHLNECIAINWYSSSQKYQFTRLFHEPGGKSVCMGAVSTANYTFTYHPTDGIDSVRVIFGFIDLTESRPLRQTFNIAFEPSEKYMVNKTKPEIEFSGNAGYIFGRPLLFRDHEANSSLPSPSSLIFSYTIPTIRRGNGQCSNISMESIKFGLNLRSGCMLNTSRFTVESQMCQLIQLQIIDILDGSNRALNSVSIYGNPNTSEPSDWIPILVDDEPQILQPESVPRLTADERCPALVTGVSLDVFYARVGTKSQSQSKVISLVKRFTKPIDVRVTCYSLLCRTKGNGLMIELSASVNFIDVTLPLQTKFAPPPVLTFQLPSDFFYPFMTSFAHTSFTFFNSQSIIHQILTIILVILSTINIF